MKTEKKNLRRISIVVTAQTKGNLERLAAVCGYSEIGRVVDKFTREKMLPAPTAAVVFGTTFWKSSVTMFLTRSEPRRTTGTARTWFLTTSRQRNLSIMP